MNTESNSAWTVNNNVVMQWSSNYDDDYDWNGVEVLIMAKYDEYELPCLKFEMMTSDDCKLCINLIWLILISKCSQNVDYEL